MRHFNRAPAQIKIDPDGNVRVSARILKEGVFDYAPSEMNTTGVELFDGRIKEYIPRSEFTEAALSTLEGKPVIVGNHEWQTAKGPKNESKVVGAVAGKPRVVNGGIECDFFISDPDTIEQLKRKEYHDVSAGYELDFEVESGSFKGIKYSGVQRNFRFNHVLLLPFGEGRCGTDVRVYNKRLTSGEQTVKVIKKQVGNRSFEYRFNSEDDAQQAEQMAEDQRSFNAEELAAAMEAQGNLKAQIDELTAKYQEAMQTIEAQKAEIDKLFSTDNMEALANEAMEQKEDEEAILDEAVEDEELSEEEATAAREEVGNSKTFAARRRAIVSRMFQAMNCSVDHWDEVRIDASFETLARSARRKKAARAANSKETLNGQKTQVANSLNHSNNRARMLRPMTGAKEGK